MRGVCPRRVVTGRMAMNPLANGRRVADFACVRLAEDKQNFLASVEFAVLWSGAMLSFHSLDVSHVAWIVSPCVTLDGFNWPRV